MTFTVTVAGLTATVDSSDHGQVVVGTACSHCREPLKARGKGRRIAASNRAYEADAICVACGGEVGLMVVEISTIFGLEEDERVLLASRCRVY